MEATSRLDVQANFGLRLPTMGHVSAGYFCQAHLVHYILALDLQSGKNSKSAQVVYFTKFVYVQID